MAAPSLMKTSAIYGLLFAILLSGCASFNRPSEVRWRAKDLLGKELTLDDPRKILSLKFLKNGMVASTYGVKHEILVCPVDRWRIHQSRLQILDYDSRQVMFEYQLIRWDDGRVRVIDRKGKEAVFVVRELPLARN